MPYVQTTWVDNTTALNQTHLNNLEQQFLQASTSYEKNLLTPYVFTGLVCTKDGSVANQLDVTSGTAYLKQSDNTVQAKTTSASIAGQFTTSTINTTYHLYLQPDGTFYWNTANSPAANSLAIANVTTDGSGNILAVTDARTLNTVLLPGAAGLVGVNRLLSTQTANAYLQEVDTGTDVFDNLQAPDNGSRKRHHRANAGSNVQNDYLVGNTDGSATFPGAIKGVNGQATAGSFGVAPNVAQTLRQTVTVTAGTTIVTYSIPANGFYRVNWGLVIGNGTASNTPRLQATFTNANGVNDAVNAIGIDNSKTAKALDGASATFLANYGTVQLAAEAFQANTGTLTVTYATTGTPNDVISVSIERLA